MTPFNNLLDEGFWIDCDLHIKVTKPREAGAFWEHLTILWIPAGLGNLGPLSPSRDKTL
jgi:hypothetical protein